MLEFYTSTLGLPLVATLDLPGGATMDRIAIGTTVLKLVTQPTTPEVAHPRGGLFGATGIRYFTITVEDVDAAFGAAKGAGATSIIEPVNYRPGVKIAVVEDPDGNNVEFIQIVAV
jgi:catechol 2,3-dioxygenase-like lactoylglutathione lyase family enzyme